LSRPIALASLVAFIALLPREASADSVQEQAEAHALFEEALQLMRRRAFDRACPLLERSLDRAADMTTAFRLAECYEQTDEEGSAWRYYTEVAEAAAGAGMAERRDYAKRRADALAPKLAVMRISVPADVVGLEVSLDDRPLSALLYDRELRVDPGEHSVSASAPDHEPFHRTITAERGGEAVVVEIALERVERPPPPPPAEADEAWVPPPPLWITLLAVGGAGVITGLAVGGAAKAHYDDSLEQCADRACPDDALAMQDEAIVQGDAATAVFVIGGVALAAGTALWLWGFVADDGEPDDEAVALDARGLTLRW
jgi:hypothetical protein